MALRYPIKIDDIEYEAFLELPRQVRGLPLQPGEPVVIPNYDLEADLAAAALGFEPSAAAVLYQQWTDSVTRFLASEDHLWRFLGLLNDQGLEALGVDQIAMGDLLSRTYTIVMDDAEEVEYKLDFEEFWDAVKERYPTYGNLKWDQEVIREAAEEAYHELRGDLFAAIEPLYTKQALYEISYDRPRIVSEDDTSIEVEMGARFYLFGDEHQHITIRGTKAFRDVELEEFEWEADEQDSGELDDIYREILEEMGEETDLTEILKYEAEPWVHEPEMIEPDWSDEYTVFINGALHGRFEDPG